MRSTNRTRTVLLIVGLQLLLASTFADGCFVFRWDKKSDINEPTQKAVILHHAGREDLLLQVKYEGSVGEFGWLIPVPSLPTVERGSMDAFYELSQLTQSVFGGGAALGSMKGGLEANGESTRLKVIETKTVGAYRISILAANDAVGLENWLKENGYAIPGGPAGRAVADDYIKRRWFFVATKIDLSDGTARRSVQQKLASGELHPLLISFETAKCVFPLKISSVAGKPSEVSLYVISEKPLLNRFVFDEACANLEKQRAAARTDKTDSTARMVLMAENSRVMQLQSFLYSQGSRKRASLEDLRAMVRESAPPPPEPSLDEQFYGGSELLHCMSVKPDQIAKASRSIPRLKNKTWYLTKLTRTFAASEMRDLEFELAAPALAQTLPTTIGQAGAFILTQLGPDSVPVFIDACRSNDPIARENGARGLGRLKDTRAIEALRALLQDKTPEVRLQAARAAGNNWDPQFIGPLVGLFRDPYEEIRAEAIGWLASHEAKAAAAKYVAMTKDADSHVRMCALGVLIQLSPDAIPREPVLQMLKDSNPDAQSFALHTIWKANRNDIATRADLLPLLSSSRLDNIRTALNLIARSSGQNAHPGSDPTRSLTLSEALPLLTNRFAEARVTGLRVLSRYPEAKAIELTLPLLRDQNPIVQNRAFATIKSLTGETLSDTDPAKWETWWKTNKQAQTN